MMAALLRHGAARRLTGSMVQRALAEERCRLGPRLMHTEEQIQEAIRHEVRKKKGELFDLMLEAKPSSWRDIWLLLHLSKEITPRPHHPDWCDIQKINKAFRWMKNARFNVLGLAGEDIKKEGGKSMLEKWREGRLAFERFDEALTNVFQATFGVLFSVYAILACKDTLVEKWKAETDKK